jgi:transposase
VNRDSFRRLEVITGVGRRRRWSLEEKARIVAESLDPTTTSSAVARRYGLHTSQLFVWRQQLQRTASSAVAVSGPAFVPVLLAEDSAPPAEAVGRMEIALGPAVVLSVPTLPTNTACGLVFSPDVVDKSGIGACVGKYSDNSDDPLSVRDRAPECEPGDFSAFSFTVEPLAFATAPPQLNGSTGVSRTNPVVIQANAPVNPDTIDAITITPAVPGVMIFLDEDSMGLAIIIAPPAAGFAPNTLYTVTVPTSVLDTYGKAAPQTTTFTFTTAP